MSNSSIKPISSQRKAPTNGSVDYFKDLGEKTQLIINAALDAIVGINTDGLISMWNPQAETIFGWKKEEVLGHPLTEKIVPPQYRQKHDNGFKHYLKTGEQKVLNRKLEVLAVDRNGREFPIEISILPIMDKEHEFFCAFIRDISERKQAECKLKESEEKFKSLVQNSSDVIGIYNIEGECKYISPNVLDILGYEPMEFLKLNIKNNYLLVHPDDLTKAAIDYKALTTGVKINVGPYRFKHKNGQWCWMESHVTNLFDDPIIQGLVINSSDVTEQILLQEELDRKKRQNQKEVTTAVINAQELERSQLGQELHDNVNQVLTTVKLYNEMLLDSIGDSRPIVEKSICLLQNCINEIRNISKRLSAPTLGNITLQDSIKELVESINLTQRIKIAYSIEGLTYEHISQEIHLCIYRIVQEQLNNIIKYAEATNVSITIIKLKDQLSLIIKDDGKGFNLHAKRSGIGITNMKTRTENLNGNFLIWSQPEKGCKLQVSIPI